jgi:hypothetical protein
MTIQLVNRDEEAAALARIRRLRRTTWLVWLAGVPIMAIVGVLLRLPRFALAIGMVWSGAFVVLALKVSTSRCPRCGNLYHVRWGIGGNVWSRRCMHCGLALRGEVDA